MKIFRSSLKASPILKAVVVTLGNFDGLHRGHAALLTTLKLVGKREHLTTVVYTFSPHPVKILAPDIAPPLINTEYQKAGLIGQCKPDVLIFEPFNTIFSHMKAEDFFITILGGRLKARHILVGHDFTFGFKREGNIETLEALGKENGVEVTILKPIFMGATLVSSTLIRSHLQRGEVSEAAELMGRPFALDGEVVKGVKRGAILGFKTANIDTDNELIPPPGVYATRTRVGLRVYNSVTNIGFNPTFANKKQTIETHIFKFARTIYGKQMRVYFVQRLRDEIKFAGPEHLSAQITRDVQEAKRILLLSKVKL